MTKLLDIKELSHSYGSQHIVEHFNLSAYRGEVIALMGPSGCGKTTLLRLVAGLEVPESGSIEIEAKRVMEPPGGVFFGFQNFDAFPWLSVKGNVQMARKFLEPQPNCLSIESIIEDVGLQDQERKFPSELSGGMRKRLAFARCLASSAKLVLLDEPFASLDVRARIQMQHLLHKVVEGTDCCVIIVTHDAEEAVFLGTRIVLCNGPPLKVHRAIGIGFRVPRSEQVIKTDTFESAVLEVREHFRSQMD